MITGELGLLGAPISLRILIIAPAGDATAMLKDSFCRLGHSAVCAATADEGLQCFVRMRPDVVLVDLDLAQMGALALVGQLRAGISEEWTRIVLLGTTDREDDIRAGLAAGGDDFFSKPISLALLEARCHWLQRSLAAQRQAILSLKRINAISDNVLDAIVTIDSRETIVACNAACERIFGWKRSEMLGQNVRLLMPAPFSREHADHVATYIHGGAPHIIGIGRETLAQRRDGSVFPIDIGVSEVRMDDGRLFVGIIRDISARKESERRLRESTELLQRYHDEAEAEALLARRLIERHLQRPGLNDPQLSYWFIPANNFSGDVLAATRSACGRRYAMLADATGHGLTAAISALPVLAIFYGMAKNDALLTDIVVEINSQLRQSMPVGRFVAAALVCIDESQHAGEIWVGGVPDALLLDHTGSVVVRFPSQSLALGVVDSDRSMRAMRSFAWTEGSQMLFYSDGLLEASNATGEAFGWERLLATLSEAEAATRAEALRTAFTRHLGAAIAHDDVSALLLHAAPPA
ncbi:SpoIIE family protein phosphatase [Rhodocyclus tenuis]|uniref:Sensor protein FixL n=1 Tax=Rhodocyclus tenuis TaxID=1066 RepID=A0A840G1Q4_RHOTE|nr:SpoIIE family protein phosphatase [Rhodocyclus tenuis]MBB4245875.1 PAS domain S-box-containing protein [Rhodocyclus tenuis]